MIRKTNEVSDVRRPLRAAEGVVEAPEGFAERGMVLLVSSRSRATISSSTPRPSAPI
jgi:hypothetical protein